MGRTSRSRVDTLKGGPVEAGPMTADDEPEEEAGIWARTTAPQSDFTTREVGEGFVVLLVGLVVAFVLPLLLA